MNRDAFVVTPNQNIYKVYGIVEEDFDDLVIALADENNLALPESTAYWEGPVETVDDLINFVMSFLPRSVDPE